VFLRVARTGKSAVNEHRVKTKDGILLQVEWHGQPLITSAGRIEFFFGVGIDLTERRKAEQKLWRLATVVEQAAEAVLILDEEARIQYVNPAFERITGYTVQEAMGRGPSFLSDEEHGKEFYDEIWAKVSSGEVWRGRFRNRTKDGTVFYLETTLSPVRDLAGNIVNFVEVGFDATQEIALEAQLRQAQKMEAVGRLAGGIAHDFNNILTTILGHAELLQKLFGEGSPDRVHVDRIYDAGHKAAELTRQLLLFSRKQVAEPRVVDLNEVIVGLGDLLRGVLGREIPLRLVLGQDLWKVRVDPGQFDQVLMDLAVNSTDAMPDGGELSIETSNVVLDNSSLQSQLGLEAGDYVNVRATDTGCGMTAETAAQAFEPFFTTKEAGRGTGLGLSIVYGIIRRAGGQVRLDSEQGSGTTFDIYLPATSRSAGQERPAEPMIPGAGRGEAVLVVEDDEGVRELTCTHLLNAGYYVIEASDGMEAQALAKSLEGSLDLLVTDLLMPGMSGVELARILLEEHPHLSVVFMSAYTDAAGLEHGELPEDSLFIQKPFSELELTGAVRTALDCTVDEVDVDDD